MNPGTVLRELRRIHLRLHHASKQQMANFLKAAGVPRPVLCKIGQIVDTCDVCRKLQAPGNKTVATARVVSRFNDMIQHDIMFSQPHPVILEADGGTEATAKATAEAASLDMSDDPNMQIQLPGQEGNAASAFVEKEDAEIQTDKGREVPSLTGDKDQAQPDHSKKERENNAESKEKERTSSKLL